LKLFILFVASLTLVLSVLLCVRRTPIASNTPKSASVLLRHCNTQVVAILVGIRAICLARLVWLLVIFIKLSIRRDYSLVILGGSEILSRTIALIMPSRAFSKRLGW